MKNTIDLSICIVNWNASQFILDCLKSIKQNISTKIKYEVVVVDNGSTDDSITRIQKNHLWVKVILHKLNNGFAAGNNIAIAHSSGRYILLLNPDTLVSAGPLEAMVNFMDANIQVGCCGPELVHPDSGVIEMSARSFPKLIPLIWNLSYVDRIFPHSSFFAAYQMTYELNDKQQRYVDWITGACMMVRSEAIKDVGVLDENIFMYCEDIEWCYRLKQSSWQVLYLPEFQIAHYRGQSSKLMLKWQKTKLSVWGARQYVKSILYFYHKHYGEANTILLRIVIILSSILKCILWLTAGVLIYGVRVGFGRARAYFSMFLSAFVYNPTCK